MMINSLKLLISNIITKKKIIGQIHSEHQEKYIYRFDAYRITVKLPIYGINQHISLIETIVSYISIRQPGEPLIRQYFIIYSAIDLWDKTRAFTAVKCGLSIKLLNLFSIRTYGQFIRISNITEHVHDILICLLR